MNNNIDLYEEVSDLIKKAPIAVYKQNELLEELKKECYLDTDIPSSLASSYFNFSTKANAMLFYIFKNFEKIDQNYMYPIYKRDENGDIVDREDVLYENRPFINFKIAEIIKELGIAGCGDNREDIRNAFKELSSKQVERFHYRDINGDEHERNLRLVNVVDTNLNKREIAIYFDREIYEILKLCHKSYYSSFMFDNFITFSSKYTQRIFMMLISVAYKQNYYEIAKSQLNKRLKTDYSEKELKEIVLDYSVKELNSKVKEYDFKWEENKKNTKKITIFATKKEQYILEVCNKYINKINEIIEKENKLNLNDTPFLLDYKSIKIKEEEDKKEQEKIKEIATRINLKFRELTGKNLMYRKFFIDMINEYPIPECVYIAILEYVSKKEKFNEKYLMKIIETCYVNAIETKEDFEKHLDGLMDLIKQREERIKKIKEKKKNKEKEEKIPDNYTRDYNFLDWYDKNFIDENFKRISKPTEEMKKIWEQWKKDNNIKY